MDWQVCHQANAENGPFILVAAGSEIDNGIRITRTGILPEPDKLRLVALIRSADSALAANFSLAAHLTDANSAVRVAQADSGIGPGTHVRKITDIDVSALPPGDYELQVAIYDWRTGERLLACDPETGIVSDMRVLRRIRNG